MSALGTITSYASGMSSITDFEGFAAAGAPVGVMAQDVSIAVMERIAHYTLSGGKVFVDSGAFPAFVRGKTVDFPAVLAFYRKLVSGGCKPANLALVAPDVIGDMDQSAELQIVHMQDMKDLVGLGVELIVPLQLGWDSQRYRIHYALLKQELGEFTPGFAYNKAAWKAHDVASLVRELGLTKIHLFGIGKRRIAETAGVLWGQSPSLKISCDSNRLRAMVGQGRKLTTATEHRVQQEMQKAKEDTILACCPEGQAGDFEFFAASWDDTEEVFELYNTPGYLAPSEAKAWAMALGVTDRKELSLWGRWSQEEADAQFHDQMCRTRYLEEAYGCKLGYLIDSLDLSGNLFAVRNPHIRLDAEGHLRAQQVRPSLRAEEITRAVTLELGEPLPAIQMALGF
ncbi:hypothetical protein [Geoalkalibacter halelectricus]|uniref:hypothetical protein n=1 Tax=Geoalkalibacter halelectricus TaxID=2847045 RepID=UPI00266EE78B|nr:hypothetical protein [Geoalkalibacter halelectricus]MDO3380400.1 hypothetical protein [Geoalkalibacter halelectricus]